MENLKDVLEIEMTKYAGEGFNGHSYLTINESDCVYALVTIAEFKSKRIVDATMVAHLQGQKIIIEKDLTNKPLVDALIQAGVPEDQIELRYLDEYRRIIGQA